MRYRLLLLLIGLAILTATTMIVFASHHRRTQPSQPLVTANPLQVDDEEYAVYSLLINNDLKESADRKRKDEAERVLIIDDHPSLWQGINIGNEPTTLFDELKKSSPELQPETVNDLEVKSNAASTLERKLDIKIKYVLASHDEIEGFFKEGPGGWKAFYEKYPKAHGFATFSRVGFNSNKTQALVYKSWHCGGLCGSGGYILLTKKNGVWVAGPGIGPTWVS